MIQFQSILNTFSEYLRVVAINCNLKSLIKIAKFLNHNFYWLIFDYAYKYFDLYDWKNVDTQIRFPSNYLLFIFKSEIDFGNRQESSLNAFKKTRLTDELKVLYFFKFEFQWIGEMLVAVILKIRVLTVFLIIFVTCL